MRPVALLMFVDTSASDIKVYHKLQCLLSSTRVSFSSYLDICMIESQKASGWVKAVHSNWTWSIAEIIQLKYQNAQKTPAYNSLRWNVVHGMRSDDVSWNDCECCPPPPCLQREEELYSFMATGSIISSCALRTTWHQSLAELAPLSSQQSV